MKSMLWAFVCLLSHWRRHPIQFFSLLLGLWLATALWSGVHTLNSQAKHNYQQAAALFSLDPAHFLQAANGQTFDQQAWLSLRRLGWPVSPVLEGRIEILIEPLSSQNPPSSNRLQVVGIDPISQQNLSGSVSQLTRSTYLNNLSLNDLNLTDFITKPGRTLISATTLRKFGWQVGDQPFTSDHLKLPPLAIAAKLPPNTLLMDIGFAQDLLHAPKQLSRLLVADSWLSISIPLQQQPSAELALPLIPASLAATLGIQLEWQQRPAEDALTKLTDSFHLNLTALGLLAFAVGLFIVHATLGLALEQRQNLLRNLRASGIALRPLMLLLLIELSGLALLGGVLGIISGYWLAAALLPDMAASLQSLYGARVAGELTLLPSVWLSGLAMSLGGTLWAGGNWLYKAASLPILGLAQPQAWYLAEKRRLMLQLGLGLFTLSLTLIAYFYGNSLLWGLTLLGGILLTAALLLPVLLHHLLNALLALSRYCQQWPLVAWFWADSRQQLPGLSLALMALLLAQTANIGVGTMTEGFRLTFNGWLDQRLAADAYIRPTSDEQTKQIITWLAQQPSIDAILPSQQTSIRLDGWPVEVSAMTDHSTFRDHWPLLQHKADAWQQLHQHNHWLISEQLAYRSEVSVGDTLTISTPKEPLTQTVVGIYADYGNASGQLLMNRRQFNDLWPDQAIRSIALRLPADKVDDILQQITQQFDLPSGRALNQASLKNWSSGVFERTFAATSALNSLTLGLAALALLTNLLTLSQTRLPQLAPLWAAGITPNQLAGINLLQILLLALLTALLAIPLGLLLAWGLVSVVNVQAFGWRLPLHIFPELLFTSLWLALITAFAAALWPGWQLKKHAAARLIALLASNR